eukprot:15364926-Ditylum_brightwellii.AAC.2
MSILVKDPKHFTEKRCTYQRKKQQQSKVDKAISREYHVLARPKHEHIHLDKTSSTVWNNPEYKKKEEIVDTIDNFAE